VPAPPLRRGYNFEQTRYVPAPTGGWNPDVNWWELPDDQAAILNNFIVRPGKIVSRGPLVRIADIQSHVGTGLIIGYNLVDAPVGSTSPSGLMNMWYKADSSSAYIDPWNAPLLNASAASLASALNAVDQLGLDQNTVTAGAAPTIDKVGGPRWINFDGLMYGISYDSSGGVATDTNVTYHMKPLNLLTMPVLETPGAVSVPTVLANAPHGAFDLKGYLGRIWLIGGIDTPGGLAAHEPTTIYYTIPGTSGVGSASADWRDPVAGTTNKLRMDNNNADYGVGLALAPNTLVVFRHSSVWVLKGTTSSTFQLQVISREVGCIDARSIVETDRGVYWLSHRGLMFTDGSTIRNVSGSVQNMLVGGIGKFQLFMAGGLAGASAYATAALTSEGQIYVSIGLSTTPTTLLSAFTGMFDPSNGTWVRHTSTFFWPGVADEEPFMMVGRPGRQQLYSLGNGATQKNTVVQFENAAWTGTATWGNSFLRQSNSQNGLVDYDPVNSQQVGIPWAWQTKLIPMTANSRRKAQLKRIFIDYVFDLSEGGGPVWLLPPLKLQPTPIPQFSTIDPMELDTTSNPGQLLGGGPAVRTYGAGRRSANYEFEVPDMFLTLSADHAPNTDFGSHPTQTSIFEVYGIGIEYQETRDYDGGQ
jgi:hypothetical protein